MSMETQVGNEALVPRCVRFSARVPKYRYAYAEDKMSVRSVDHRRASMNNKMAERSIKSSADKKGAGSQKMSCSKRPCDGEHVDF
eukprot:2363426-Pleurochrysis_carterae.AAC.2